MKKTKNEIIFPDPGKGFTAFRMNKYSQSFVSGDENSESLRIKYYIHESDKHIVAYAWFGPKAEGPPDHAHGGSIAAILDEAMGATPWANNLSVLAANINIRFIRLLPLDTIATVECWIKKIEGRKVWTKGEVRDHNGKLFSKGEGLYILVPINKFANVPEDDYHKYKNLD